MQKALSRITWKCVLIGFQMVHSKETRMSKGNNSQLIERIKTPELPPCQAIITLASCMHDESFSYASIMPDWLTQAFFNPELQRQRLNVHQFRENDNVITMGIMDDLHLADFVELQLKSKHDFDAAYDVALSAGLGDYVRRFVVIQPGDWPCQFYCR